MLDATRAQFSHETRVLLEAIARELETRAGNKTYKAAWKIAAKIVRDKKPD
jgi:hypothetical protein